MGPSNLLQQLTDEEVDASIDGSPQENTNGSHKLKLCQIRSIYAGQISL